MKVADRCLKWHGLLGPPSPKWGLGGGPVPSAEAEDARCGILIEGFEAGVVGPEKILDLGRRAVADQQPDHLRGEPFTTLMLLESASLVTIA